jgi:hypothetical protein
MAPVQRRPMQPRSPWPGTDASAATAVAPWLGHKEQAVRVGQPQRSIDVSPPTWRGWKGGLIPGGGEFARTKLCTLKARVSSR